VTDRFVYIASPPAREPADIRAGSFTAGEWLRVGAIYGCIALLHLLGGALLVSHAAGHPALPGLALAAYLFGMRHAFDADHIAAVDDSVRYMLHGERKPLAVGWFFSLGHSTIVLAMAVAIALAANRVSTALPGLQSMGALIGPGVAAVFLWLIGILNLMVLIDLVAVWRGTVKSGHGHAHVDELLRRRGLISRLLRGRLRSLLRHSWQMFPLGLLFGLGFDTASEVGLLAMTAGAASGNLPIGAVLSLPILFAAGMTLMDTTDGVLMCKAYAWALHDPMRRVFYNVATTGLTVAIALVIGTIELLQVLRIALHLDGRFFDAVGALDLSTIGYVSVALFAAGWAASVVIWKAGPGREPRSYLHAHRHTHADGTTHSHPHRH
jgi:high-affinity nickel-transport protein